MKKIINIKELAYSKSYENDFEDFIPIWAEYWKEKDPMTTLYSQIITSTRLLQLEIICELKATINMLK